MSLMALGLLACSAHHAQRTEWAQLDPDLRRPTAPGHAAFNGELQVGTTYEAFGAVHDDGDFKIVASRFEPAYFQDQIHWRNGLDALVEAESGTWHAVVFDVVTVTESAVERDGVTVWEPEYECDIQAIVPAGDPVARDLAER